VDGAHRTVTVDRRIIDMLLYAKEMYATTDGIVNVAMGSVLSLWHDYRTVGMDNPAQAALPPMDRLQAAAAHTDITKVVIDEQNNTVTLQDPLMTLDVGAIAKGYAAGRVYNLIASRGLDGYAIDLGGNLRVVGTKPNGDGWVSGIRNPDNTSPDPYVDRITISDSALVTSGVYERFYVVDGVQYHHIINKDTLMPERNYLSVTVHTESSAVADALSTALFNMSVDEGRAVISTLPDTEIVYVLSSGEVVKIEN
jgi:thiamine biosynthesis lipoprotein